MQGDRPYPSYKRGVHPQDSADLQRGYEEKAHVVEIIKKKIQQRAKELPANSTEAKLVKKALAPNGGAWDETPLVFILEAVSDILAEFATKVNLVIDTINYLHLGQGGFIPHIPMVPPEDPPVPGYEYEPWPPPVYPSSTPPEDRGPIETL